MSNLEILLTTLVGNSATVMLVAFLAKTLLSQVLEKDLKRYEADLLRTSEKSIEDAKAKLEMATNRHNVRFVRLHEKQAQFIENAYSKILEFEDTSKILTIIDNKSNPEQADQRIRESMIALSGLELHLKNNKLYFPLNLSLQLDDFLQRVSTLLVRCDLNNVIRSGKANKLTLENCPDVAEAWNDIHRFFSSEAPDLKRSLEGEFRKYLGTNHSAEHSSE